ncbi:DUF2934 domain-containing protein [Methylopila musalis]|uniref:DUF2934 domain-containing protein n=1 Tax=Methylopila musalis TaxID=1134781 RepID=A0ABW3Z3E4_9HYPH
MDRTQDIRDRAYQIWIEEGQPTGREREHWEQASRDLDVAGEPEREPATGAAVGGGEKAAATLKGAGKSRKPA